MTITGDGLSWPAILGSLLRSYYTLSALLCRKLQHQTKNKKNLANRIGPALCKRVTEIFLQYTPFSRCSRIVLHTRIHVFNPDLPIWGGGPSSVAIG